MKRGLRVKFSNKFICQLLDLPEGSNIEYITLEYDSYYRDGVMVISGTDEQFPEWKEGERCKDGILEYTRNKHGSHWLSGIKVY